MAERFGTIQVKEMRRQVVVIGMGKTGRGQRYIKKTVAIGVQNMRSKNFKGAMASAVAELFDSEA